MLLVCVTCPPLTKWVLIAAHLAPPPRGARSLRSILAEVVRSADEAAEARAARVDRVQVNRVQQLLDELQTAISCFAGTSPPSTATPAPQNVFGLAGTASSAGHAAAEHVDLMPPMMPQLPTSPSKRKKSAAPRRRGQTVPDQIALGTAADTALPVAQAARSNSTVDLSSMISGCENALAEILSEQINERGGVGAPAAAMAALASDATDTLFESLFDLSNPGGPATLPQSGSAPAQPDLLPPSTAQPTAQVVQVVQSGDTERKRRRVGVTTIATLSPDRPSQGNMATLRASGNQGSPRSADPRIESSAALGSPSESAQAVAALAPAQAGEARRELNSVARSPKLNEVEPRRPSPQLRQSAQVQPSGGRSSVPRRRSFAHITAMKNSGGPASAGDKMKSRNSSDVGGVMDAGPLGSGRGVGKVSPEQSRANEPIGEGSEGEGMDGMDTVELEDSAEEDEESPDSAHVAEPMAGNQLKPAAENGPAAVTTADDFDIEKILSKIHGSPDV